MTGEEESADSDPPTTATPNLISFANLANAGNTTPHGIWSNGTTMWVLNQGDDRLYAYNLTAETRDPDQDITLDTTNTSFGIWSNGTTMWAVSSDKLVAYDLDGDRVMGDDFNSLDDGDDGGIAFAVDAWSNQNITGVAATEATMWILDFTNAKIFAYNMMTKMRDDDKDITLATGNTVPFGMWSNGTTMWVSDYGTNELVPDKLFAYNLITGNREPGNDFDTLDGAEHNDPSFMWSDGTTMWLVDFGDDVINRYNLETKALIP